MDGMEVREQDRLGSGDGVGEGRAVPAGGGSFCTCTGTGAACLGQALVSWAARVAARPWVTLLAEEEPSQGLVPGGAPGWRSRCYCCPGPVFCGESWAGPAGGSLFPGGAVLGGPRPRAGRGKRCSHHTRREVWGAESPLLPACPHRPPPVIFRLAASFWGRWLCGRLAHLPWSTLVTYGAAGYWVSATIDPNKFTPGFLAVNSPMDSAGGLRQLEDQGQRHG